MKTALDHLPDGKQRELAHVVEIVRAGFARATAQRTQPRFRNGALLKIILFGSYARGDWVEDPVGRYFSDYDLLVVVNHEDLTDIAEFWEKTEAQLLADLSAGTTLRTPVSLIYHSLEDVNEKLRLGRYFFMDIVRDGIALPIQAQLLAREVFSQQAAQLGGAEGVQLLQQGRCGIHGVLCFTSAFAVGAAGAADGGLGRGLGVDVNGAGHLHDRGAGSRGGFLSRVCRFFQQCHPPRLLVGTACGTQGKAGFHIELGQQQRGHFIHQPIHACSPMAREGFEALVLIVGQTNGEGAHGVFSFKKCSGVCT